MSLISHSNEYKSSIDNMSDCSILRTPSSTNIRRYLTQTLIEVPSEPQYRIKDPVPIQNTKSGFPDLSWYFDRVKRISIPRVSTNAFKRSSSHDACDKARLCNPPENEARSQQQRSWMSNMKARVKSKFGRNAEAAPEENTKQRRKVITRNRVSKRHKSHSSNSYRHSSLTLENSTKEDLLIDLDTPPLKSDSQSQFEITYRSSLSQSDIMFVPEEECSSGEGTDSFASLLPIQYRTESQLMQSSGSLLNCVGKFTLPRSSYMSDWLDYENPFRDQ